MVDPDRPTPPPPPPFGGPRDPAAPGDDDDGDTGPIGIFPSWAALYVSVVLYTLAMVAILHLFTVTLDHGLAP